MHLCWPRTIGAHKLFQAYVRGGQLAQPADSTYVIAHERRCSSHSIAILVRLVS
jgi:hypothetical protein